MKKIFVIAMATLAGVCFGVAVSTHLLTTGALGKTYRAYIVQSGSMEPALPVGAIVFSQSREIYNAGEIITFKGSGGSLVTHRIVSVENENGRTAYKTKGDANEEADGSLVKESDIVGASVLTVPYVGYFADFVRTPKGFVIFVVIPAAIIVYEEIKSLFKEIKRIVFKRGGDDRSTAKTAMLVPVVGIAFLFVSQTGSYFLDSEKSTTNALGASDTFSEESEEVAPPSPARVVINEIFEDSDNNLEWVELYNAGGTPANLKNWTIKDATTNTDIITLADYVLNPDSYVVIGASDLVQTGWAIEVGKFINLDDFIGSGFNADGDIALLLEGATEIDKVTFGTVPAGSSIERNSPGADTNSDTDFFVNGAPSPGF